MKVVYGKLLGQLLYPSMPSWSLLTILFEKKNEEENES
jgi:hypothetical protein